MVVCALCCKSVVNCDHLITVIFCEMARSFLEANSTDIVPQAKICIDRKIVCLELLHKVPWNVMALPL